MRKEEAMKRTTVRVLMLAAIALAFVMGGCGEDDPPPLEWRLVFADEFDGPAGQLPDDTKWKFDVGVDWGNAQLEYDTNRPENVSLDGNGNLAIIAREETYQGPAGTREYTSGRINTQGLFAHTRGRFEARIKLPVGQGLWPAFWLLGGNFTSVGWPGCGEIDIMEYRGQEPSVVSGALHGPGYSGGASVHGTLSSGMNLNEDFHVFAVDWDEEKIAWSVDGKNYQTFTPQNLPAGKQWVFNHSFFVILNVAVGGHFVGSPDSTTVFPQTMLVDWVRVHAWKQTSDGG